MRHAIPYRKLSRQRSHYTALMRNLALSLIDVEKIRTTEAKAKEVRRVVDRLITLGKSGTLHDRRRALSLLGNIKTYKSGSESVNVLDKLFNVFPKRLSKNKGGYTRLTRLSPRPGDAAPMVLMELVVVEKAKKAPKKSKVSEESEKLTEATAS